MTCRSLVLCAAFAPAVALPLAAQTKEDKKSPIKGPTVEVSGSLDDLNLAKQAPQTGVIVTAKGWEQLAEAWGGVKRMTIWRQLQKIGYTHKKRPFAMPRGTRS